MNSKYGNITVEIDGFKFDSKKEGYRYLELKILLRTGKIRDLVLQPEYVICHSVFDPSTKKTLRARKYIADFSYVDVEKKVIVVEDVKSVATANDKTYRLKRQLFLSIHKDLEFREIL